MCIQVLSQREKRLSQKEPVNVVTERGKKITESTSIEAFAILLSIMSLSHLLKSE